MKIILASKSSQKLLALKLATQKLGFTEIQIETVQTTSDVNEQPLGFNETYEGAMNRAIAAKNAISNNTPTYSIGIESGILEIEYQGSKKYHDLAIVVIISPNGKITSTNSVGIEFGEEYVKIARNRGFKTNTVGSVIAQIQGGDPTDPHSTISNNQLNRMTLLSQAIESALIMANIPR